MSFKKRGKFFLTPKDWMILNVQYRLYFTKVCEMGGIFDKSSLTLRSKLIVLKNFLLMVEREVYFPREHTLFFITSMLRASKKRAQLSE